MFIKVQLCVLAALLLSAHSALSTRVQYEPEVDQEAVETAALNYRTAPEGPNVQGPSRAHAALPPPGQLGVAFSAASDVSQTKFSGNGVSYSYR